MAGVLCLYNHVRSLWLTIDTMNACIHKLNILNRHDSEQISRANLLQIARQHATTDRARVEAIVVEADTVSPA